MSRLRFRSTTSLAVVAAVPLAAACGGDDRCGPGNASASGIIAAAGATGDAVTLTYGQLSSGLNNDCPVSGAPPGVVSLTISGTQTDGSGALTLCVSRPDLLADRSQALGPDAAGSEIRVIDLRGASGSCTFTVDRSKSITGSATSQGMCGNGSDAAGFALTLDGALALTRTCGATVDSVQVTLRGSAPVSATPD